MGGALAPDKPYTKNSSGMNTLSNTLSLKQWYALYTRPKWEKKVAGLLVKKQVESYCPLNKVTRQWSDRKKVVYEPLFSSYVFVHVSEHEHLPIKQTDGVLNFVHWLGRPAIIKPAEIEAIRMFVSQHENAHIALEKIRVDVNDKVRITDGALIHSEGQVLEVKNKSVKVFLPSLGYAMTVEVSRMNVEVV
jgi:transcription antitermination factor NusG